MRLRSQSVIDFLVSYGIGILIITVAFYVIFQQGILNIRLAPTYCNGIPGFTCQKAVINSTGSITLIFIQTTGGTLNVTGAACSTAPNSIATGPLYGNVNVLPYSAAPQYYPNAALSSPMLVYSSNITRINIKCYSSSGVGKGGIGGGLSGFVWLNYTVSSLPNSYKVVQQVASFDLKYT